jgi:hypothetical protein
MEKRPRSKANGFVQAQAEVAAREIDLDAAAILNELALREFVSIKAGVGLLEQIRTERAGAEQPKTPPQSKGIHARCVSRSGQACAGITTRSERAIALRADASRPPARSNMIRLAGRHRLPQHRRKVA